MNAETVQLLHDLNQQFYRDFAAAFASTRRRIQPGVERVLAGLPDRGDWLDLGCGSGWLALEWLRKGRTAAYLGLDFSAGLLDEAARQLASGTVSVPARVRFELADLTDPIWQQGRLPASFEGGMCFAVLHHIPAEAVRLAFLRGAARLIRAGGLLAISVWQFQHSPKLLSRQVEWSQVGLNPTSLEPGDALLDWRHTLPGTDRATGYRYVHLFSAEELERLAAASGFAVVNTFESDGEGGRLGLYQTWQRLEDPAVPSQ